MLKNAIKRELRKQVSLNNLSKLAKMLLAQNTESIDVSWNNNRVLHQRLSAHIIEHAIFDIGGSKVIRTTPKGRKTLCGDGLYFYKDGPSLKDIILISVKTQDAVDTMDNVITLTVPIGQLNRIDKLLDVVYPANDRLPVIYNAGRNSDRRGGHSSAYGAAIGVIPRHFGKVEQFVNDDVYERVDTVIDRLVNNPDWYDERNKTRKETFYLYGPPGTGKTTLIRHMASKYNLDVVIVKTSMFASLSFMDGGKPVIYLMEDIDSDPELIKPIKEDVEPSTHQPQLMRMASREDDDYSSFINTLDGAKPLVNAIVVMTTNYPEKILPSVIRKGRVDHRILVDHLSIQRICDILNWDEHDERREFIERTRTDGDIPIGLIPELKAAKDLAELIDLLEKEDDDSHLEVYTN